MKKVFRTTNKTHSTVDANFLREGKTMKLSLRNKKMLAAITTIGLAGLFFTKFPFAVGAGIISLGALLRLLRITEGERNWKTIQNVQSVLADYEEIIDGQLWFGKDAEILASDRVDNPREPGPVVFEYICRTKNGAWFVFDLGVISGRVVHYNLNPCDEATAKKRLQRHKDVFVRCFGQPTNA